MQLEKKKPPGTKVTRAFKDAFIEMLREIPIISTCCKLLGVSTSTMLAARKKDPDFDEEVKLAVDDGYDSYEEEARRRAVEGVKETVYYRGEEIGEVTKYSDQLLTTLLRARRPKAFNPGARVSVDTGEKITMVFEIGNED